MKMLATPGWRSILGLWPLLLPLVLLVPAINAFPYPSTESLYSDLTITHYPYARYLREALLEGFRFPQWYPYILSGHPLASNPLAGVWYPPSWLALALPLPLGFNLGIALHLLWGGMGIYALARQENHSRKAALFAGLAFVALPKLYAHYGAGHLTLLYAVPWTPWLLWASQLGREHAKWRWLPAIMFAMIILADPRWAPFAGVLWWGYALVRDCPVQVDVWTQRLLRLLAQTALAVALAAPSVLPLLEFARLSSRAQMSAQDVFSFSLPPARLLGLVVPDYGGFHEWMLYPGAAIFTLCLLALAWSRSLEGAIFWAGSAALSLLFSLGSFLPLLPALARLPIVDLLRVPPRALFLTGISMVMLAAHALDHLLAAPTPVGGRAERLLLFSAAIFAITLAIVVWMITAEPARGFLWGAAAMLYCAVWIGLRLGGSLAPGTWFLGLVVFCLLDWGLMARSLFVARSAEVVFAENEALSAYLARQPGYFRVYSPSYSLPQQMAVNDRLQLADGVDPLQLSSYVAFMEVATGVPMGGYSVTVPPFAEGEPKVDNAAYLPDSYLLGRLNVRYIAAEFDLNVNGLVFLGQFGGTRLYENQHVLPRAWVQPGQAPIGESIRPVQLLAWTPERIALTAEGPGMLVLSELAYPGWQVQVDGVPGEPLLVANLLRGVQLEAGKHQVVFTFRSRSLYLGVGLWALACVFLTISGKAGRLMQR